MWIRTLFASRNLWSAVFGTRSILCSNKSRFYASYLNKGNKIFVQRHQTLDLNEYSYSSSSATGTGASGGLSDAEVKRGVEDLSDKFSEARELLDDARESMDTVYFSEDMKEAEDAVKETLQKYETLLQQLDKKQKEDVVRTIGLRMEELKAQVAAIQESLHE